MADRIAPVILALTTARLAQNVTQSAIERKAGLSNRYISRLERGAKSPSLDSLERWADALGYEITLTHRGRGHGPRLTRRVMKDLNRRRAAAALTPDAPIFGGTQ